MLGLYRNRVEIVLQERLLESCVAIQCIVLQQVARLVRKICIAIHLLYCDRKARQQARWGAAERAGARAGRAWGARGACVGRAGGVRGARAGRAWGAQVAAERWALGERSRCRHAGRAGRATGAAGARGRGVVAARRARGARGARRQRAAGARAGTAWARRGARLGARCARGTAGLGVAWALDGCAGWASFGALCTWLSSGSVFRPGSTWYFPESPNEHCSL